MTLNWVYKLFNTTMKQNITIQNVKILLLPSHSHSHKSEVDAYNFNHIILATVDAVNLEHQALCAPCPNLELNWTELNLGEALGTTVNNPNLCTLNYRNRKRNRNGNQILQNNTIINNDIE